MTEDYPNIDDLVSGINDPDVSYLDGLHKAAQNDDAVGEKLVTKGKVEDMAETKVQEKSETQPQVKAEDMDESKKADKPMQVKAKESAPATQPKTKASDRKQKTSIQSQDQCWLGFMEYLQHLEGEEDKLIKNGCPVVRLERVLAATIDECNIFNRSRSEIVNAIVQSFLDTYMGNILPYHTIVKAKTLFEKYNSTKQ